MRHVFYLMQGKRTTSGQSTLEYALVLLAFLATVATLGLLWHAGKDGGLLRLALKTASHLFDAESGDLYLQDILLF
jgi:hypothetical protein